MDAQNYAISEKIGCAKAMGSEIGLTEGSLGIAVLACVRQMSQTTYFNLVL
jgi:hypothetical protein